MNTSVILILIVIGLAAGVLSGIMGVGGGVVMIPLMMLLLGLNQHQAQGTSLAVLAVPVTFLAAYNYYGQGYVNWKFAAIIAVFFVIGGYFGSNIAVNLSQKTLKRVFGGILFFISIKMILGK